MTTVAFKDGMICADTQATTCDIRTGHVRKIFSTPNGKVALIGSAGEAHTVMKWIENGAHGLPPMVHECHVVRFHGESVTLYANGHAEPVPEAPFLAFGSGRAFALGAMAAGATAEEAIRISMLFDVWTGGQVERLRLDSDRVEVLL